MQRLAHHFRATFSAFVIIGAAVILAFPKQIGPGTGNTHWIMVSLVISLMAIFGVIVWIRSRGNYDSEADADSFYYLGFLYTLITLVATFTPLLVAGKTPDSQYVLGLFGLGLITTFVGLAGRVFFLQPRSMISTDDAAQRLAQAYSQAARDIEATTIQMSRLASDMEKITTQSHENLAALLERETAQLVKNLAGLVGGAMSSVTVTTSEATKRITEMAEGAATDVTSALEDIGARLVALKLPPEELGVRLQKQLEILIAATGRASDAVVAFEKGVSPLRAEFVSTAAEVSSASTKLAAFSEATVATSSALAQTQSAFENVRTKAESMQQTMDSVSGSAGKLGNATKALSAQLTTTTGGATALASALTTLIQSAGSTTPAIEGLGLQVENVRERLTTVVTAISATDELARRITLAQLETSLELGRGVDVLKSYQTRVEALSQELERDLKASENAIRKVHENLINATEFIVSQSSRPSA